MIFNNSLTVYHKKDSSFKRQFYLRAHIFSEDKISQTSGNRTDKSELIIRIFSSNLEDINAGDKVYLGFSSSPTPPKDSHTILSVKKNLKGSNKTKHCKIKAI